MDASDLAAASETDRLIHALCRQAAALEDIATQQTSDAEVFRKMAVEGIHALARTTAERDQARAIVERQRNELRTARADLERYTRQAMTEAA